MTNPHAERIPAMVADVRRHAAYAEHPWDCDAISWPDLPKGATVVEVGGYTGRWSLQMVERYDVRLFAFEPQPWAAATCRAVLGDRARVLAYALGDRFDILPMADWETDGCNFIEPSDGAHVAPVHEMEAAFEELGITHVDLLLMNIEGYEYTLLPHMLDRGLLPQRLVVQFHIFDDYGVGMGRIFDRMAAAGYRVLWTYGVVLTAWERKE